MAASKPDGNVKKLVAKGALEVSCQAVLLGCRSLVGDELAPNEKPRADSGDKVGKEECCNKQDPRLFRCEEEVKN